MLKQKKLLIFLLLPLTFLYLNSFIFDCLNKWARLLLACCLLFLSFLFWGIKKGTYRFKQDTNLIILFWCISSLVIQYAFGFLTGFLKSPYSFSFLGVLENLFYTASLIIVCELLRYILAFKSNKNKIYFSIIGLIFILLETTQLFLHTNWNNPQDIVLFWGLSLLPSISKNVFLIYLTRKAGYIPCILYRFITEAYIFFVPFTPDFDDYINSLILLIFPFLLFYRIFLLTEPNGGKKISSFFDNKYSRALWSFLIVLLIIFTCLISNLFRFYAVTIATGSMEPNIHVGDMVIVDKYYKDHCEQLKQGDILLFKKENKIVSHRIISVSMQNNKYLFYTKGDANTSSDNWTVYEEDIIGTVVFRLLYIGYPSVLLYKLSK